jgi:hypothetical protein
LHFLGIHNSRDTKGLRKEGRHKEEGEAGGEGGEGREGEEEEEKQ